MKQLIKELVEINGPSGYEQDVRDLIHSKVEPYADEIWVDSLGNLIVRKGLQSSKSKKILLAAHMDEPSIMATHIDERGFVRFTPIGGLKPHTCLGTRVRFVNGTPGVIGAEWFTDLDKMPPFAKLFIDVGSRNRGKGSIKIGDAAVFDYPFQDFGDYLVSKAMDNRIGIALLISTLQQINKTRDQLFFVFTVQEHVGLRGVTSAAFDIEPDLGVVVDVTDVGDTPNGAKMEVALGKGPAIKVRDDSLMADPRLVAWMESTAEKIKTPYQHEVWVGGWTDAAGILTTRSGVPSICLSIPARYLSTPSEMVDYTDVQEAVQLLLELVSNPINFC